MFCVLLYARVRPSDTAFETHLWSLELPLEIQLLPQLSALLVDLFREVICCTGLHCIWDILLYFISNSDVYIVASWTTILSIPLRIIVLLCVCDSVIDLFTVYAEFCQIFITICYFELFKSDMCGFIVDLNGPK